MSIYSTRQLTNSYSKILSERHILDLPATVKTKADAADINLFFSDNVKVRFHANGDEEELHGRWCMICKYVSTSVFFN